MFVLPEGIKVDACAEVCHARLLKNVDCFVVPDTNQTVCVWTVLAVINYQSSTVISDNAFCQLARNMDALGAYFNCLQVETCIMKSRSIDWQS